MINFFVKSAFVDVSAIKQMIIPSFLAAAKAGAQVGLDAHLDIISGWSHQPEIKMDNIVIGDGNVSVDVTVEDTADSWWEAVDKGSTSPATSGPYMTIGPYSAHSQPGTPVAGDGSKFYDGVIRGRGPSVTEPRDFIGYVIKNYSNDILEAIAEALQ